MNRKKVPIILNRKKKSKFYGETDFDKNGKNPKVTVYLKSHIKKGKLDRAELASTVKHELKHADHPNMTEKKIYKETAKTKLSYADQQAMLSKLRMKKLNYKGGAIKRKFKMKPGKVEPGEYIKRMNESKSKRESGSRGDISKERLSIIGLV